MKHQYGWITPDMDILVSAQAYQHLSLLQNNKEFHKYFPHVVDITKWSEQLYDELIEDFEQSIPDGEHPEWHVIDDETPYSIALRELIDAGFMRFGTYEDSKYRCTIELAISYQSFDLCKHLEIKDKLLTVLAKYDLYPTRMNIVGHKTIKI